MVVGVAGNLGRKLASLRFASADVDLDLGLGVSIYTPP